MPWGDDFSFDDSSPRVRRQFGDLFGTGDFGTADPNPTYERDNFARDAFQVPEIGMSDYGSRPQSDAEKYFSEMQSLYSNTPSMNQYRDYAANMPKYEDYKPGWWTRIAAALAGGATGYRNPAAGVQTAININRSKYDLALQDYYKTAETLGRAANTERQTIGDKVQALSDASRLGLSYDQYRRQVAADQSLAAYRQGTLKENTRMHDATIGYQNKRLSNDERNYNSLDAYRKAQVRNQAGMLGVAQQNADTNRDRATTDWFRASMQGLNENKPPSAQELGAAQSSVTSDMLKTYPELFAETDSGAVVLAAPPPVGTPEYFRYQEGLRIYRQRIQQRAGPGQVSFDTSPDLGAIPDPGEYSRYSDVTEEQ